MQCPVLSCSLMTAHGSCSVCSPALMLATYSLLHLAGKQLHYKQHNAPHKLNLHLLQFVLSVNP